MSSPRVVLDTSVLSAFHTARWFDAIGFWRPNWAPTVSERAWTREFVPNHGVDGRPDWLTVAAADLSRLAVRARGQLSKSDWTCRELAEHHERAMLVTNDSAMKNVAERRDLEVVWGTAFAKATYERCGMTPTEFEDGVSLYVDDVYLPQPVATVLATAEKPGDRASGP